MSLENSQRVAACSEFWRRSITWKHWNDIASGGRRKTKIEEAKSKSRDWDQMVQKPGKNVAATFKYEEFSCFLPQMILLIPSCYATPLTLDKVQAVLQIGMDLGKPWVSICVKLDYSHGMPICLPCQCDA